MKRVGTAFLIISLAFFYSCKKDSVTGGAGVPSKLIAATISGSMASNGMFYYYPKSVIFLHDTINVIAVDTIPQNNQACDGYEQIFLIFKAKNIGSFPLAYGSVTSYGYCSLNSFFYTTDSSHIGSVNITKLDTINHSVSGAFSFNAEMQSPIRNGGSNTICNGSFNNLKW